MKRILNLFIVFTIIAQNAYSAQTSSTGFVNLVHLSRQYVPVTLVGLKFYPDQPFRMDFIVNKGSGNFSQSRVKADVKKLIKYFLAALTIKPQELWVNLSPYEPDRIVPTCLSHTQLGQDMLEQDYFLKQLAASLTYPESSVGKKYWQQIYKNNDFLGKHGNAELAHDENKVWIIPDKAKISEDADKVIISDSRLKVMTEADYAVKAADANRGDSPIATDSFKKHILPLIEEDVNHGENFVPLRQLCSAVILAAWFKHRLGRLVEQQAAKGSLSRSFFDKGKIKGAEGSNASVKEQIYQKYLKVYTKGAYDYVKSEEDPVLKKRVKRNYFSGGVDVGLYFDSASGTLASKPFGTDTVLPPGQNFIVVTQWSPEHAADKIRLLSGAQHKTFSREELITRTLSSPPVRVKGREPDVGRFQHDFRHLWVETPPSESVGQSVELIAQEFAKVAGCEEAVRQLRKQPVSRATWSREEELSYTPQYKIVHLFFPFLTGMEDRLFGDRQVYPFSWRDLNDERIFFSLGHVDTRVKLILQDIADPRYGILSAKQVPFLAERAHMILAHLLKTEDYSFTRYVNNMLVVYLQDRVIQLLVGDKRYQDYKKKVLVRDLEAKNDAALKELKRIFGPHGLNEAARPKKQPDERLVALQVMAGVCFPQDRGGVAFKPNSQFIALADSPGVNPASYMVINDLKDFIADIEAVNDPTIICLIDDVGEGVFDLFFIRALLNYYPKLKVTIRVNKFPVENNFWEAELYRVLDDELFADLRKMIGQKRLLTEVTNNPLLCPDVRFLPRETLEEFRRATILWIKGAAFFETVQISDANKYYGFANYHTATKEVSGVAEDTGVFAHVPRGFLGYEYIPGQPVKSLVQVKQEITAGAPKIILPGSNQSTTGGIDLRKSFFDPPKIASSPLQVLLDGDADIGLENFAGFNVDIVDMQVI